MLAPLIIGLGLGLVILFSRGSGTSKEPVMTTASAQKILTELGYNPGPVDGMYGPATRRALAAYQEDVGLSTTGEIDGETSSSLANERVPSAQSATFVEPDDESESEDAQQLESGFIDPDEYDPVGSYKSGYNDGVQQARDEKDFGVPPLPPFNANKNFTNGWWDGYDGEEFNPPEV